MPTTERECIDALREAAERLGESPSKAAYENLGLTPASATIVRVVGGWNAAKELAGLETNPSTGSRVGPQPEGIDLPGGVDWADLSVDQRWHYRNRDWNAERTQRRRDRRRSWVDDRKRARGCERCGVEDPARLEFHHTDEAEKAMGVGVMVNRCYPKVRLRSEIRKCELLCANCHRKEHHERPDPDLNPDPGERSDQARTLDDLDRREWVYEYKRRSGGCNRCDETDPRCLDFHHLTDDKRASVSKLVTDDRPETVVRAEIERCVVLCANCHRREHVDPPGAA